MLVQQHAGRSGAEASRSRKAKSRTKKNAAKQHREETYLHFSDCVNIGPLPPTPFSVLFFSRLVAAAEEARLGKETPSAKASQQNTRRAARVNRNNTMGTLLETQRAFFPLSLSPGLLIVRLTRKRAKIRLPNLGHATQISENGSPVRMNSRGERSSA